MNPEIKIQPPNKTLNRVTDILFYSVMFIFIVALAFPHNPVGNWYQQFMPNIGGRTVTDVFFLDSLTGWAVTNATNQNPDTTFVLKTTNSGDSWVIQYRKVQIGGGFPGYTKIFFLNQTTGYVSSVTGFDKTINGGANWTSLFAGETFQDISIISNDTIWIVSGNPFTGGVFRTTNGGANWEQQLNLGSNNPNHIYMYNGRIGFISNNSGTYLRKTTNSGQNWDIVFNKGFSDMFFIDSLKGWSAFDSVRVTTNGGLNWQTQLLPYGGNIYSFSQMAKFDFVNKDTIWGVGGRMAYPNNQNRGIIYKTIDGGNNWLFQLPDTNKVNIVRYSFVNFYNDLNGWAYSTSPGVHTTNGGDTVSYLPVYQSNNVVPKEFVLYQNYPNPFNPTTKIKYSVKSNEKRLTSNVKLILFDINGREVNKLVDNEQIAGTYEVDFNGSNYSSGVYFYSLIINGNTVETKKMLFIK